MLFRSEMVPGGFTLVTIKVEPISTEIPKLSLIPELVSLGNGLFFIFEAPLAIDDEFNVQSSNESSYTGAETIQEYGAFGLINSIVSAKSISSQCS